MHSASAQLKLAPVAASILPMFTPIILFNLCTLRTCPNSRDVVDNYLLSPGKGQEVGIYGHSKFRILSGQGTNYVAFWEKVDPSSRVCLYFGILFELNGNKLYNSPFFLRREQVHRARYTQAQPQHLEPCYGVRLATRTRKPCLRWIPGRPDLRGR